MLAVHRDLRPAFDRSASSRFAFAPTRSPLSSAFPACCSSPTSSTFSDDDQENAPHPNPASTSSSSAAFSSSASSSSSSSSSSSRASPGSSPNDAGSQRRKKPRLEVYCDDGAAVPPVKREALRDVSAQYGASGEEPEGFRDIIEEAHLDAGRRTVLSSRTSLDDLNVAVATGASSPAKGSSSSRSLSISSGLLPLQPLSTRSSPPRKPKMSLVIGTSDSTSSHVFTSSAAHARAKAGRSSASASAAPALSRGGRSLRG